MDDSVIAGIARWPNVPHVYGWLSLDRRGQWRLRGNPITNPHITEFIGRNYASDERGAWFFQNGPQRVYVKLDYAPWILRTGEQQMLITHTGQAVQAASAAWLDEAGNLLIAFDQGIGLIEDRDLPALLDAVHDATGKTVSEDALMLVMSGTRLPLTLNWNEQRLPLEPLRSSDVPGHFGFIADPQPGNLG
ncbi:MAG: DUF2946 family protein [Georgfuchsia sp.]